VDVEIDLGRLSSKLDKMLRILHKECPKPSDAHVVSVMLVAFFEESMGVQLAPETLSAIRAVFVDSEKSNGFAAENR
jgi:hypothetical protein